MPRKCYCQRKLVHAVHKSSSTKSVQCWLSQSIRAITMQRYTLGLFDEIIMILGRHSDSLIEMIKKGCDDAASRFSRSHVLKAPHVRRHPL